MKAFGIVLIILGIISFTAIGPATSWCNFKHALQSAEQITKNDTTINNERNIDKMMKASEFQFPNLNEYTYTKYSRIAGGIGVVFGLFCFFLGMSLEKKEDKPKPNFNIQ